MRKTMTMTALVAGCSVVAMSAFAADKTGAATAPVADKTVKMPEVDAPVMFPKAGAETKALKPIFVTASWTDGKVHKGSMGPDSPEGTSKGKQTCKWAADDLWAVCDIEDTSTVAKRSATWKGHVAMGWDFAEKTYKGVMVSNMGMTASVTGKIEGTRLTMTADKGAHTPDGKMMLHRYLWDWADGKTVKFSSEMSLDGGATWAATQEFSYKKGGST